jgi:hypothetical protein
MLLAVTFLLQQCVHVNLLYFALSDKAVIWSLVVCRGNWFFGGEEEGDILRCCQYLNYIATNGKMVDELERIWKWLCPNWGPKVNRRFGGTYHPQVHGRIMKQPGNRYERGSTLKREAAYSSKISVLFYQTRRSHISEDRDLEWGTGIPLLLILHFVTNLYRIWGSRTGGYGKFYLLWYTAV